MSSTRKPHSVDTKYPMTILLAYFRQGGKQRSKYSFSAVCWYQSLLVIAPKLGREGNRKGERRGNWFPDHLQRKKNFLVLHGVNKRETVLLYNLNNLAYCHISSPATTAKTLSPVPLFCCGFPPEGKLSTRTVQFY